MSGMIPHNGKDCTVEYYNQRLNELKLSQNPRSISASSNVGSLSETTVNGHYFNSNRPNPGNGTLSTHQFYRKNPHDDERNQNENLPSTHHAFEGASTYSAVTDDSVFKKPQPMQIRKKAPSIMEYDMLDLKYESIKTISTKEWSTFKFIDRTLGAIYCAMKNPPQPMSPVHCMDYISHLVKEKYLSKQFRKANGGSSIISDQSSCIDQYAGNSERLIQLEKQSRIVPVSDSRSCLQDITQSNVINSENSSISKSKSHQQQEISINSNAGSTRAVPSTSMQLIETLTGNTFNFFNDSEIAQRRDALAAGQESHSVIVVPKKSNKSVMKATPKPATNPSKAGRGTNTSVRVNKKSSNGRSKVPDPVKEKSTYNDENENISLLNGTACGTSRSGRTLKPPAKYWGSKDEEMSYEDYDKTILNESMTLRNKKVVEKKKTPPLKGTQKNTPTLQTLKENEVLKPSTAKEPKGRGRPPLPEKKRKEKDVGKEKEVVEKKKAVKKIPDTPAVKISSTKGKTNKKKEETTRKAQDSANAVKKPAPKRKSKESNETISKKKKVEVVSDPSMSDLDEDDIFGAVPYKKPTHQNLKVALSPTAALLSAKKAAGEAQGKATPPCKALSSMLSNESIQSTMSAPREAPKKNDAINRLVKKMGNDLMKAPSQPKPKNQSQNSKKKDSKVNDLLEAATSKYYVSNPMCSASLSVMMGTEEDDDRSDNSNMEEDEDSDLF